MTANELMELIKLLTVLPIQKQKEFYYMIKGAAFIAEKNKPA